jgi:proton-dependent oligopeptide transporter, POT family
VVPVHPDDRAAPRPDPAPGPPRRWPAALPFIVGNEACERFSFYGMRSILTVFLVDHLLQSTPLSERAPAAKEIFHLFVMAVYFFPLLGGYLADRLWGKYRTIFWLSLVYCGGHACLALFDDWQPGFYAGLGLIALGSGGIKPCVSAFVGDQLTAAQKSLMPKVFAAFYWSINLGSLFASLFIPKLLRLYGPKVAFGLPGILMLVATLIFWLGRRHYHEIPPSPASPHSVLKVLWAALLPGPAAAVLPPGSTWLDRARVVHPPQAIEDAKSVLAIVRIFAFIPFFWMLFDQKASAWVLQARSMELGIGPFVFEPSQLQFINPALVLLLIPLCTGVIYPALEGTRWRLTPVRRMTFGMFAAGLSFVLVALIQIALDRGMRLSVMWQLVPYVALTLGEIFVSITGLEFAYSQAPRHLKGLIQSLWFLTTAAANLVVAIVARLNVFSGAASFLFYAALVTAAGVGLFLVARRHVSREFYREPA